MKVISEEIEKKVVPSEVEVTIKDKENSKLTDLKEVACLEEEVTSNKEKDLEEEEVTIKDLENSKMRDQTEVEAAIDSMNEYI